MKDLERKKSLRGNIIYGILLVAAIFFTVNSSAKALLIKGLMNIGFFQVNVDKAAAIHHGDLTAHSVPEAVFKDGEGNEVTLSSLKGKVVFINFWATWCPPCVAEMSTINRLHDELRDNDSIVFLMVDVDGKYAESKEFMEKHKYSLPVYTSVGDVPYELLGGGIPTTDIINKEGKLMIRHEGAANYADPEVKNLLLELINR